MRHVKSLGCLKVKVLKKISGAQAGSEKRWKKYTLRSCRIIFLIHIIIIVIITFVVNLCVVKKAI
jgi:hypothetical protein